MTDLDCGFKLKADEVAMWANVDSLAKDIFVLVVMILVVSDHGTLSSNLIVAL